MSCRSSAYLRKDAPASTAAMQSRLPELTPTLRGVVVVRGDSGLGKTSMLREMAARATRPVAFLHARDCAEGVDTAISRIIHDVQEIGFV